MTSQQAGAAATSMVPQQRADTRPAPAPAPAPVKAGQGLRSPAAARTDRVAADGPGTLMYCCAGAAAAMSGGLLLVLVAAATTADPVSQPTLLMLLCITAAGAGTGLTLPILWRLMTLAMSVMRDLAALHAETNACHHAVTALAPDVAALQATVANLAAAAAQLRESRSTSAVTPTQPVVWEQVWRRLQPLAADDTRALAIQVADRIRQAITAGRLAAGAELPTNAEISRHLCVSTVTVRRAIRSVCDSGAIRTAGRGRYVVSHRPPAAAVPSESNRAKTASP